MDSGAGSYLRLVRKQQNQTLRQIQQRTGISNAYLSQIENGKVAKPSPKVLHTLSEAYDIPYENLLKLFEYTHLIPDSRKESTQSGINYEELLEKVAVGVFIIRDNSFRYANHTFCQFLDYTLDELQDIDPLEIIHPHDKTTFEKAIELRPEGTKSLEYNNMIMLNKNGGELSCHLKTSCVYYQGTVSIMGSVIDVREQKRKTLPHSDSYRGHADITNNLPFGVMLADSKHEIISANKYLCDFIGVNRNYLRGKKCCEILEGKESPDSDCPGIRAMKTRIVAERVARVSRDGDEIKVIRCRAFPAFDEKGDTTGFIGFIEDISNKDTNEMKPNLLSETVDGAKASLIIADLKGVMLYANKSASKIWGYTIEEMVGKPVTIFTVTDMDGSNLSDEIMSHVLREGVWSGEFWGKRKDGRPVPIRLSCCLIRDEKGNPVATFGISEDLTEKKELEEQVRAAEEKYFYLRKRVQDDLELNSTLIGNDPKLMHIKNLIKVISDTDVPVLIQGETGTGKDLVANLIKEESSRKDKPFVQVNCGALAETLLESELFGHEKGAFTGAFRQKKGKFELADGGTIFLDEIGDISPRMQVAILRAIETGEIERVGGEDTLRFDVRIIAATNKRLDESVREGKFRKDLFYRLNTISLTLPPLRERKNDILLLINRFLEKYQEKYGKKIGRIPPTALRKMLEYSWPGNVRELEHFIERMVLTTTGSNFDKAHDLFYTSLAAAKENPLDAFPGVNLKSLPLKEAVMHFEGSYIRSVLEEENNNIDNTLARLRVSRSTLYEKLKRLNS